MKHDLHTGHRRRHPPAMKIHHKESGAIASISTALTSLIGSSSSSLAIVCVGTDRSTGDSLGPLVGSAICEAGVAADVYGTLDEPIHAVNLADTMSNLPTYDCVLAIDACLGYSEDIGFIFVHNKAVKPGSGVNKILPAVGNLCITGAVNVMGFMEHNVLQNTRLSLVMRMSRVISNAILESVGIRAHKKAAVSDNNQEKGGG